MRPASGLRVLAVSGALAGCGDASATHPATGAALFAQDCSVCHSLVGKESPRRQGGDLLGYRFSRRVMLQLAREMPVRRPLSSAELGTLARYVTEVERRGRAR